MKRQCQLCVCVWAISQVLFSARVSAAPIGLVLEGTVSGTLFGSSGPVQIPQGTPLSATLVWDSAATDFCPSPTSGGFYLTGTVDFLGYRYTSSGGIESNSQGNSCMGEAGGVFFRLVGFNPVVTIPGVDPLLWVVPAFFLGFESGQIDALTPTGALPVLPPFGPINGGIVGRCLNPPGCFQQPSLNGRFEATRAVVPEPATLSLVGAGLIAAWLRRRRSAR